MDKHCGADLRNSANHQLTTNQRAETLGRALRDTGHVALLGLKIRLIGKSCYLQGNVSSYYLKQLAQEAIRPHLRGIRICNLVSVGHASPRIRNAK